MSDLTTAPDLFADPGDFDPAVTVHVPMARQQTRDSDVRYVPASRVTALEAQLAAAEARANLAYEEKALADREFLASQALLASARQEAEGLRAQVRAFLKADNEFAPPSTMDAHRRNLRAALSAPAPVLPGERRTPPAWWNDAYRDDVLLYACATAGMDAVDVIREQHRQRAQWEKIAHDAVATQRPPVYIVRDAPAPVPAPVPATPVSAIHNVGKPCPVCSGCDVCLGTGRAPHYVPAPVPATPAPDALALLREARKELVTLASQYGVSSRFVDGQTCDRVQGLVTRIDAALAGRA